jgi:hypothetical protein
MTPSNIDLLLENSALKNEFAIRNLDLTQVFCATPEDLGLENRRLRNLLDWVDKYTICPSREKMEADGFLFPPIEPDFSPDDDWALFERWMKGLPVRLKVIDQLKTKYLPKNPTQLDDEEAESEIEYLCELLNEIHISIDVNDDIPPGLLYENLYKFLYEELEIMTDGICHMDGCSGYCPDCYQRPWCETGRSSCWTEDEKIGEMYLPDSVRKYVSASPVSLEILRKKQAEEDEKMAKWKAADLAHSD